MSGKPQSTLRRELGGCVGFTARYGGFWLAYFLLCRVLFLGYHLQKLDFSQLPGIIGYGEYIDLASTCYLMALPFLFWSFGYFLPWRVLSRTIACYSYFCILLVALISVADLQLYQEWGTKINAQALNYLRHPAEAAASVYSSPLLLLVLLALALSLAGLYLFNRICRLLPYQGRERSWPALSARIPLTLFAAALIFLGIRGSVGVAPMNPSFVYFSQSPFANHATLNTSWNLFYDIKYFLKQKGNNYVYLADDEMQRRVDRLLERGRVADTERILTTGRPNIVVFILESWTADVIESLGGERGITPFFGELSSQGLLFTDFYANGYRSSFGIPAVLAGYPSTTDGSVLNHPLKMERLPTLGGSLRKAGYATQFHYGGDDRFDDMNAFLVHSGFQKVVDREGFAKKDMNSKWGAQDHVLFDRVIDDLKGERTPFFSAMFTLSSHEPFEVPMAAVFPGTDEAALFKNAVLYSDRSLRRFFERARKEPWYANTLFVLVADHGSRLPLNRPNDYLPERYRIPLLLVGDVLKKEYRGVRKASIASQSDIAATVLAQLGLPHREFEWSNDLLDRGRKDFAFYNFHTGFALRTGEQTTVFDNVSKKVILRANECPADRNAESLKDTQAYMQYLFKRYRGL